MQVENGFFSKELITIIISVLTFALAVLKSISSVLNKSIGEADVIYKKAGLKIWKLRLFAVNLPVNKVPKITKGGLLTFSFITIFCIISGAFSGYYNFKIRQIPDGWIWLTFKKTNEDFLLTKNKASEQALHPSWYITMETCKSKNLQNLVEKKKISQELHNFICSIITNEKYENELKKSIEKFQHEKRPISLLLTFMFVFFLWIFMNAMLTFIYTIKLRKSILKEHKDARNYLT